MGADLIEEQKLRDPHTRRPRSLAQGVQRVENLLHLPGHSGAEVRLTQPDPAGALADTALTPRRVPPPRTEPVRKGARMLTISPAAAAAIESMLSRPEVPEGSVLRILRAPSHHDETVALAVVDRPHPRMSR